MRNLVLRIIVIDFYFTRGCPLEEESEHCSHFNKGIILVCYPLYFFYFVGNFCDISISSQYNISNHITSSIRALSLEGMVG
jgi:hypothetical protein